MRNLLLITSLLFTQSIYSQSIFEQFDVFINKNVVFGLVKYAEIKERPDELHELLLQIANHSPTDSSADYQTAFYINSYNVLVIKQVIDNYPINSPMDVEGFFKVNTFDVAGESLTLDEIEFDKLINRTNDPRIHFALGCGARSCPFLYGSAFIPNKLEEQLNFRAIEIIERTNYVYVEDDLKRVTLNKIFDWYGDQFESAGGTLIKYVNTYKTKKVPEVYSVRFMEYDWSLNDLK